MYADRRPSVFLTNNLAKMPKFGIKTRWLLYPIIIFLQTISMLIEMWTCFAHLPPSKTCLTFMMWAPMPTKAFATWLFPKKALHGRAKFYSEQIRTHAQRELLASLQPELATRMPLLSWVQANSG